VQCETTSERRMLYFLMLSTARWRARKTGSKMAVAGLLFLATLTGIITKVYSKAFVKNSAE
jgi:hypothetical protein